MRRLTVAFIVAVLSPACGGDQQASLHELARSRAGAVEVLVLSSDEALPTGGARFTLEFRRPSDGALLDVGPVKAHATMPMAGMAPMIGPVVIERDAVPGRYVATTDLRMAGEWRLSVEWNGAAGQGAVGVSLRAH